MTTLDAEKREYRLMNMSLIEMSRDKTIDSEDFRECVLRHICVNGFGEEIYSDHIVRTSLCDFIKEVDLKMSTSVVKRDMNVKDAYNIGNAILRHYEWRKLPTKGIHGLNRVDEVRLAFEAAFVSLIARRDESREVTIDNVETFLTLYPEFAGVEMDKRPDKLTVLLDYRNWMRICLLVISPEGKKDHLLDLVTRLAEGKHKKYIAGSGETPWTARRVLIYRREGNVQKNKRPPRRSSADREAAGGASGPTKKTKVYDGIRRHQTSAESDDDEEGDYNVAFNYQRQPSFVYPPINVGMPASGYTHGQQYMDLGGMSMNLPLGMNMGVGVTGSTFDPSTFNGYYEPAADLSSFVGSLPSSNLIGNQSILYSSSIQSDGADSIFPNAERSDCTDNSNTSSSVTTLVHKPSSLSIYSDVSSNEGSPRSIRDAESESKVGISVDVADEASTAGDIAVSPLFREGALASRVSHSSLDEMDLSSHTSNNEFARVKSENGLMRAQSCSALASVATSWNASSDQDLKLATMPAPASSRSFSPLDMLVAAAEQVSQLSSSFPAGVTHPGSTIQPQMGMSVNSSGGPMMLNGGVSMVAPCPGLPLYASRLYSKSPLKFGQQPFFGPFNSGANGPSRSTKSYSPLNKMHRSSQQAGAKASKLSHTPQQFQNPQQQPQLHQIQPVLLQPQPPQQLAVMQAQPTMFNCDQQLVTTGMSTTGEMHIESSVSHQIGAVVN